jgi:hypothetical protein
MRLIRYEYNAFVSVATRPLLALMVTEFLHML